MQGRTHLIAGLLVGALIQPDLAIVVAAGVGALLPDIDHPNSLISRRVGILAMPVHLTLSHRGALHSGLIVALLLLGALYVPERYRLHAISCVAGYASHLLLDALTVSGIPLLWPHSARFRLLGIRIRTGSLVENLLSVVLLAALLIVFALAQNIL